MDRGHFEPFRMTDRAPDAGPRTVQYAQAGQLRAGLAPHALWFHVPDAALWSELGHELLSRVTVHVQGQAAALTVSDLAPADIPALSTVCRAAFLAHSHTPFRAFADQSLQAVLATHGLRCFRSHSTTRATQPASVIGTLEFLVSSGRRLMDYPSYCETGLPRERGLGDPRRARAVFILDLIQDFEILRPAIAMAAQPFSPFQTRVAVSDRVLVSPGWAEIDSCLSELGVPWFKPLGPADVAAALGTGRALLLTASESSAPGHVFVHECCRSAPPRTVRVTFQHGHECVGLRHHRAHDLQFAQGVRFASDLIFCWQSADELPHLHPADRDRCIAVGVTKSIAHRAAALLEEVWAGTTVPHPPSISSLDALMVAENLHSVRFTSPQRYERFLRFIENVHAQRSGAMVVRSHPGKRTLEKSKSLWPYVFLEGTLSAEHFFACKALVSPPSTILLDAALCARPAAVWSDAAELGDAANYAGLPVVTDAADMPPFLLADTDSQGLAAFEWAVANTASLNGHAAAWQQLCSLLQ